MNFDVLNKLEEALGVVKCELEIYYVMIKKNFSLLLMIIEE